MKIKFWGTRGSLPKTINHLNFQQKLKDIIFNAKKAGIKNLDQFNNYIQSPMDAPLSFGGNTSCYQITQDDFSVLVDLGSGAKDAGLEGLTAGIKDYHIFLTHMHWDHIIGLNFFMPLYNADCTVTIHHVHKNTPQAVEILFNGTNFPVKWDQLSARIQFSPIKLYSKQNIGPMTVSPFSLDHPGGSFGYRFEYNDESVGIGIDGEYKRRTRAELGRDLAYYQNLDAFLFDAQYSMDELNQRIDWGHSSGPVGVELALRENIFNLVLSHHDPYADDSKIMQLYEATLRHRDMRLANFRSEWVKHPQKQPNIILAYDGLELDISELKKNNQKK